MRLRLILLAGGFAALASMTHAQTNGQGSVSNATVVATCGTPPAGYNAGQPMPLTQDTTGKLCDGSGGGGGSTVVTQPTASLLNAQVVGNAASGATDSGNPVKTGSIFHTSPITVTDGQRVDDQANSHGDKFVQLAASSGNALSTAGAAGDASTNSAVSLFTFAYNSIFNGTTWDRWYSATAAKNTTGTGVAAAGMLGFDGTNYQAVTTDTTGLLKFNLTQIAGAAPSLTNPIWIANAEAADTSGTFTNGTQTTSVTNSNADGYASGLISINGTYGTASAVFEVSDDGGTTYYSVICGRSDGSASETGYTGLTNTNRQWSCPVGGNDSLRVRSTAVASGTVNVRVGISAPPPSSNTTFGSVSLTATSTAGAIVSFRQTTTASAVALTSGATINGYCIKALAANTGTVAVGGTGVTTAAGYPLAAGESVCYSANNTNASFIIGNGTDIVAVTAQ